MDMNRGRIEAAGATGGHVHLLENLTDVEVPGTPVEGAVLAYLDGAWRPMTIDALKAALGL